MVAAIFRSMKLEWFMRTRHGSPFPRRSMPISLYVKCVARRSCMDRSFSSSLKIHVGLTGLRWIPMGRTSTFSIGISFIFIFMYRPSFCPAAPYRVTLPWLCLMSA